MTADPRDLPRGAERGGADPGVKATSLVYDLGQSHTEYDDGKTT